MADPYTKVIEFSDEQLEIQVFQVFSSFELETIGSDTMFMIEPIVPESCDKDYLKVTILGQDQKTFIFAAKKDSPPQISSEPYYFSGSEPFELDELSFFDFSAVYGEILEQSVVISLDEASEHLFGVFTREFDSELSDSSFSDLGTFSDASNGTTSSDSQSYSVSISYSGDSCGCQNGVCSDGSCVCGNDYIGTFCSTPCTWISFEDGFSSYYYLRYSDSNDLYWFTFSDEFSMLSNEDKYIKFSATNYFSDTLQKYLYSSSVDYSSSPELCSLVIELRFLEGTPKIYTSQMMSIRQSALAS